MYKTQNGGMKMGKVNNKKTSNFIMKFIGNKNVVTLFGLLACVGVLFFGYNYRVNVAISPISVPYAKESIASRTLITSDMVGTIKVSSDYLGSATSVIRDSQEVVNKYVSYKTNIPKGSLFFKEQLKEADEMPDSAFANIEDGYTIFSLAVTVDDTYANSIFAGQYIDLYMSAQDDESDNNLVIYGRLIESIRVLAVKDKRGRNILQTSMSAGLKPAELLFAVEDEMFLLLMQSQYIRGNVKLVPVLRNQQYTTDQGETLVSSVQLQDFIKRKVEVLG